MTEARKTVVRPLGLITTPNHYGQYPEGALSQADNVVMRNAGELWTAPGVGGANVVGSADFFIRKMMPLDSGHVYSFVVSTGTTWSISEAGNSTTLPALVSTTNLFTAGRICPVRIRERMLVNSNEGILVGDSMAPANGTERALRMAGLPQPSIGFSIASSASGPIPVGIMVGYAAIFVREFSDGYIVKSVPTPVFKVLNSLGAPMTTTVFLAWSASAGLIAGDYIELYRTDGLSTSDQTADPGTTCKLISRQQLSSGDIGSNSKTIVDLQQMVSPYYTTTGRELYTNPYQEGLTGANRQPDICGAVATFKGYTFYGNLTERPQWTFSIPAGFGVPTGTYLGTPYLRANGIGRREGSGTTALLSNQITGVSAADIVGIKIGQTWNGSTAIFPAGTAVTAVGAATITMAVNALAAGAGTFALDDVVEINGAVLGAVIEGAGTFTRALSGGGLYEVTVNQTVSISDFTSPGMIWTVEPVRPSFSSTLTVRATNGANYSPPVPELTATAQVFTQIITKNLQRWSKDSEPEHAPTINETQVGGAAIIQYVSTKDALWICCTDGIYRLSGAAGSWVVDIIDPNCVLCAPQCATALREQIYAYTNYGFVGVSDSGVTPISQAIVKELMPGQSFSELADMIVDRNETEVELLISLGAATNIVYVYNLPQKAFTRIAAAGAGLSAITAIAFQSNPAVVGPGRVLFGASPQGGVQPSFRSWTATGSPLAPLVQFQPFVDKQPMLTKQWVDMTYLFDTADAAKVVFGAVSNIASGQAALVAMSGAGSDAYASVGIARQFAISPSLAPGFTLVAGLSSQTKFRGISCRYMPVSQQQARR